MTAFSRGRPQLALGGLLLALLVFAAFGQTLRFGFVNLDDPRYVTGNPRLAEGFTPRNLRGVWTAQLTHHDPTAEYWAPLTGMTRILDAWLYGQGDDGAGGHHLTNLALHALAAALLFAAVRELSGAPLRAWCVAAVFAVHPAQTEVVCWLSARKDLVSGVGFFLALWLYGRFLRGRGSLFAVFLAYFAGLLGKPALVTFPFVLMLVDLWVRRAETQGLGALRWARFQCVEKLPFLALAAVFCVVALISQLNNASIAGLDRVSPALRALNFFDSTAAYLGKLAWPLNLAVFYPHPFENLPLAGAAIGFLLALALLGGGAAILRKTPLLFAGSAWFYGMLLPVSGAVQTGMQKMADRYLYLAAVGIFLIAVFALWRLGRAGRIALLLLVIPALALLARAQTATWENSQALFRHALRVAPDNFLARFNLATALWHSGEPAARDEAVALLRAAVADSPEAVARYRQTAPALALASRHAWDRGDPAGAEACARAALRLDPDTRSARLILIHMLEASDRAPEAERHGERLRGRAASRARASAPVSD